MNLLLVDPEELAGDGTCIVRDHRALHLRSVIGVRAGWHVRAGVVGGGIGSAEIKADDGVAITLRLKLTEPAPLPLPIELVLAVPRPKVLSRAIETAAAFGVARIDLTNAWRVDKGYLTSPKLAPEALDRAARTGAEQGGTTWLPDIRVHRRLMALLDDRWPGPPTTKLVAHPGAPPIERAILGPPEPTVLAIGPEGGWIAREVETFIARGFMPVSLGAPILRVETALAAGLAQLLLLHRLSEVTS
ncbi:MAG TPA: RsmE family RNA methyltransferase [Kofleriaceae bacterium]|nr:RsmE family RNA methyltransferase [Kofleriaceae bacterium]